MLESRRELFLFVVCLVFLATVALGLYLMLWPEVQVAKGLSWLRSRPSAIRIGFEPPVRDRN
jgi:hypothetical protein